MNVGDRVRIESSIAFTPQANYLWMIGRIKKLLWDGRSAHVEFDADPYGFGGAVIPAEHLTVLPESIKTDD